MEQQHSPIEAHPPLATALSSLPQEQDFVSAETHEENLHERTQVEAQGALLSRLVSQHVRRIGYTMWSFPALYAVLTGLVVCGVGLIQKNWTPALTMTLFLLPSMLWAGGMVFFVASSRKAKQRLREMATTLVSSRDIHVVGSLVDTLKLDDGQLHQTAIQGLTDLLPRLQPKDSDLLNTEQRNQLCRVLSTPPSKYFNDARLLGQSTTDLSVPFRVAILQAFTQVGDSRVLPTVERLAKGNAKTEAQKRIQEAAQECLPAIRLRAKQEQNQQTLLRSSKASDEGADTLLRATTGGNEDPSDQLLHPSQPNS